MYKKRQIVLTQIIVYLATLSGITNISKQSKDGGNFQKTFKNVQVKVELHGEQYEKVLGIYSM